MSFWLNDTLKDLAVVALTGTLVGWCCSLVGIYLVLRKESMMGDALSHSVLPGLVGAFLVTGSLHAGPLLSGALLAALLTGLAIQALRHWTHLRADMVLGIVFPILFSLGVVLLSLFARNTDLDIQCLLMGELAYIPLQPKLALGLPRTTWNLIVGLGLIAGMMVMFHRRWIAIALDRQYLQVRGIPTQIFDYLFLLATTIAIVASFEAVGVILVLAFLVTPAATAQLLSKKLAHWLLICLTLPAFVSLAGTSLAFAINSNFGATMGAVAFAVYLVTRGILAKR